MTATTQQAAPESYDNLLELREVDSRKANHDHHLDAARFLFRRIDLFHSSKSIPQSRGPKVITLPQSTENSDTLPRAVRIPTPGRGVRTRSRCSNDFPFSTGV